MATFEEVFDNFKDNTVWKPRNKKSASDIANFYSNLTVFITGGSDLFGKCLVEKLIRGCPDIKKIYVLLRVKKHENFNEKCQKYFQSGVFNVARKKILNFEEKIVFLDGNLRKERLGLSDQDYECLIKETTIIFHNGSKSGINCQKRSISETLDTNVHGTRRILNLASDCKTLKSFVYVSTICSQYPQSNRLEEKFYPSPGDLKYVNDMIQADTENDTDLNNESLRMLVGQWSNLLGFSKAISEDLIKKHALLSKYSCCIFRPSIITSTYLEPSAGFCDEANDAGNFISKMAVRGIHGFMDMDCPVDVVPADMSVNSLLVAVRDSVERSSSNPHQAFVYNYSTSKENPITMKKFYEKMITGPSSCCPFSSKGKPAICFVKRCWKLFVITLLFNFLPALMVDILATLTGRKREALKIAHEVGRDSCKLHQFVSKNWRVHMDSMKKAMDKLNPFDKELFFCDLQKLDWTDYLLTYLPGIKHHTENIEENNCHSNSSCKSCCCIGLVVGHIIVGILFVTQIYYAVRLFF